MPLEPLSSAFVLHRRDYGNTSLLVEVLVSGQGRFPAVAKGARRPKCMASALLQPFQPLWLASAGRGQVRTLTKIEGAGSPFQLQGRAMVAGLYLNELLVRLLGRNDPHDALFAFYQAVLQGLAEDGADLDTLLRQFELRLLEELGYGLTLDEVVSDGGRVQSERFYVFENDLGLRAAAAGDSSERLSGATLLALAEGRRLDPEQRGDARRLLRAALAPHLGARPLMSRELYRRWFGGQGAGESGSTAPGSS